MKIKYLYDLCTSSGIANKEIRKHSDKITLIIIVKIIIYSAIYILDRNIIFFKKLKLITTCSF